MIGRTLGPYEVLGKLGEGGMGEVFLARDTRLSRDVAIKVLPPALTDHPDRLARFEREARVLASLSHPGIAAIYGIEESHGVRALVLELVDGGTLADRLAVQTVAGGPRCRSTTCSRSRDRSPTRWTPRTSVASCIGI